MRPAAGEDPRLVGRSVLAIGPAMRPHQTGASGQKMMFQLAVDLLTERGARVRVVDIAERSAVSTRRPKGRISPRRILDYFWSLPKIWLEGLMSRRLVVYLTAAQSLPGFLRDLATIWPLSLLGHRVVCHQFGGNYGGFFSACSGPVRALIRRTLARVDTVIVEGAPVKEQFSFLPGYQQKVRVVPNGLPERSIILPQQPKELPTGGPIELLYLSNMLETKGYWDVLRAVELLLERGRQVRCQFAGRFLVTSDSVRFRDPDRARSAFLEYLEERPRVSAVVSYRDGLFGPEKAEAFRRCHLFLLPSAYVAEGQPVSVLEALAYGCVTIATRHRLIPTMVEDGRTGFFVPYASPEAIVERVERLIDHPEEFRTLSQNALKVFREGFSAESYFERLVETLDLGKLPGER